MGRPSGGKCGEDFILRGNSRRLYPHALLGLREGDPSISGSFFRTGNRPGSLICSDAFVSTKWVSLRAGNGHGGEICAVSPSPHPKGKPADEIPRGECNGTRVLQLSRFENFVVSQHVERGD